MENLFLNNPLSKQDLTSRLSPRESDLRGSYFRDTTAIVHSYPFRRLKHKTQVFFSPKNDHICTRIEHVLHVSTVAATICRSLNLDGDLAWAIGLGHDLGHTPFGHVGEMILSEIVKDNGGFKHEMYSLRVIDYLANYGKGLNLTYAVRDGILNHCGERFEQSLTPDFTIKDLKTISTREYLPSTWEGVVVRMSDKIAYLGRDLEDAIQLKFISIDELPRTVTKILGERNSDIINTLVHDLINYSLQTQRLGFSDNVYEALIMLKEFNYTHIYNNPVLSNYHTYFERIIRTLYEYLTSIFGKYELDIQGYKNEKNVLATRFADFLSKMEHFYGEVEQSYGEAVSDYIAGMTDDYAIDCTKEIMFPKKFESQFDELLLSDSLSGS